MNWRKWRIYKVSLGHNYLNLTFFFPLSSHFTVFLHFADSCTMSSRPFFPENSLEDTVLALLMYLDQTEAEYINDLNQIYFTLHSKNRQKPLILELIQVSSMSYISCFYQNANFSLSNLANNDVLRTWVSIFLSVFFFIHYYKWLILTLFIAFKIRTGISSVY